MERGKRGKYRRKWMNSIEGKADVKQSEKHTERNETYNITFNVFSVGGSHLASQHTHANISSSF